jgi:hypothetical protein
MKLRVAEVEISTDETDNTISIQQGLYEDHGGATITLTAEQIPLFVEMILQARDSLLKPRDLADGPLP